VSDVLYVALTIVVFAVLLLILKGVERFERWELDRADRRRAADDLPVRGLDSSWEVL